MPDTVHSKPLCRTDNAPKGRQQSQGRNAGAAKHDSEENMMQASNVTGKLTPRKRAGTATASNPRPQPLCCHAVCQHSLAAAAASGMAGLAATGGHSTTTLFGEANEPPNWGIQPSQCRLNENMVPDLQLLIQVVGGPPMSCMVHGTSGVCGARSMSRAAALQAAESMQQGSHGSDVQTIPALRA